ncbi:hypothetical protein [Candidatus Williamhamiltonella defendens]|uniref:hypothetical protein n=1 Tax=Candidatus Williamhamiltonella defendens TaxID=138072 RepID=UPI00130E200B|nr:hypothetical protein [Candidatus Hamiltonella defensa]
MALLKRKNIGASDLIILIDYCNNKYTNENEFYQKIKDDVIPAIKIAAQYSCSINLKRNKEFLKKTGISC